MHLLSPPTRTTCSTYLVFYVDHPSNIWQRLQTNSPSLLNYLYPLVTQIEVHNLKFGVCFPNYPCHICTKFTKPWSRDAFLLISLEVTGM
jgi:hypothetical protein